MARKSRKNLDMVAIETAPQSIAYNAAAYVRLSADVKRKPSDSLENQRNIIENFAAVTPDIRIAKVYTDNNEAEYFHV